MGNTQGKTCGYISSYLLNLFDMLRYSTLYTNAFFLSLKSLSNALLGFLFWNLMARTFTPAQVGVGSALIAASNLIGALANLGLGVGMIRFVPEVEDRAKQLINSAFTLALIVGVAGSLVFLAGLDFWSPALVFLKEKLLYLILFVIFTVAIILSSLTDDALVAKRAAHFVFWKNLLVNIAKLPLPALVISYFGNFGIYFAVGFVTTMGVFLALFRFIPKVYQGYLPRPALLGNLKPTLFFSFGNYFALLFYNSIGFLFPILALNRLGPEASAFVYIAWIMNGFIVVIADGITYSLFAEGSHSPQNLFVQMSHSLKITILILIPIIVVIYFLAPWILSIFGRAYSENGTTLIRILMFSSIPATLYQYYNTINLIRKRVGIIILQAVATAVMALSIGYWLMGIYGVNGLGIAYVAAHSVVAIVIIKPLIGSLKKGEAKEHAC